MTSQPSAQTLQLPIFYFYDPVTFVYLSARKAREIPGLGMESISSVPNATLLAIPNVIPSNSVAVFRPGENPGWEIVAKHSGTFYNTETRAQVKDTVFYGNLPSNVTDKKPLPFTKWDTTLNEWVPDPDQIRSAMLATLNSIYTSKLAKGFIFQQKYIQSDENSQIRINTAASAAAACKASGSAYSVDWITGDNSILTMDADYTILMQRTCFTFINACASHFRELKNQLIAATTAEQLQAIDVKNGWVT